MTIVGREVHDARPVRREREPSPRRRCSRADARGSTALARLRAFGRRGARPGLGTTSSPARRSAATAARGWPRGSEPQSLSRPPRRDAADPGRLRAGDARGRRRRAPDPARPFGEDGTVQGLSSWRACRTLAPVWRPRRSAWTRTCSRRCCATMGSRSRRNVDPARRRGEPTNPFGYPVLRQAGPARLVGRDLVRCARGRTSSSVAVALARAPRRQGARRGVRLRGRGPAPSCSATATPIASLPGGDRSPNLLDGTTSRPSTTRAGWSCVVPPRVLPEATIERVQQARCRELRRDGVRGDGVRRLLRPAGRRWSVVNELNTIPGLSERRASDAKLFEASGIPYEALLRRLIELAVERHERRSKLEF